MIRTGRAVAAAAGLVEEAGPAPTTPTVGTITPYSLDTGTDVTSYTWSHTRAVGAGLHVQLGDRTNSNPSPTFTSVTYGGVAMTIRAQDKEDGANHIAFVVASMDPGTGPTGANDVVVTLSGNDARDAAGYAADIIGTAGAQQGVATTFDDGGSTAASTDITPSDADSLLVGGGAVVDAQSTLSAGAGWTAVATPVQSANDAGGVEMIIETRAPASTDVQAIAMEIAASRAMRAVGGIEWLPS